MFGLPKHGPDGRYAALIDIGSASVGGAIVASDEVTNDNPVIFSHREWASVRHSDETHPTRFIEEAILRLFLVLGNDGRKELHRYDSRARISEVRIAISAPWAHTITQQAEYVNDHPFEITQALFDSLVEASRRDSIDENRTVAFLEQEGLEVVSSRVLHVTANGYIVSDPRGLTAQKLYLSSSNGIVPSIFLSVISEHTEEIFPDAIVSADTFMLNFYHVMRDLYPEIVDCCLIDITGEATEVGTVHNYELSKTAHALMGTQTIVRLLADRLGVPESEARHAISSPQVKFDAKQQAMIDSLCSEYEDQVVALLQTLGTKLSLPRPLIIHCDRGEEEFFSKRVTTAFKKVTGSDHTSRCITSALFPDTATTDTSILLSSYLFHNKLTEPNE